MALTKEQKITVEVIVSTVVKVIAPATATLTNAEKIKARLDYFDLLAKRQKYSTVIKNAVIEKLENSHHI